MTMHYRATMGMSVYRSASLLSYPKMRFGDAGGASDDAPGADKTAEGDPDFNEVHYWWMGSAKLDVNLEN